MADLYQTLGVKKDASAAEIKTAYRRLAKQLHPDKHKDDPKAAERFKTVSAANTILADVQERAKYDRGEIDDQGNPKAPAGFGGGSAGGQGFQGFRAGPGGGGASSFDFGGGGDPSDLFAELFGRGGTGGRAGASPFAADPRFSQPAKGADRAYKLPVRFEEAARLAPQRVTLANGRTLDVKLPVGVESGTQIRLSGQGDPGPGGAGDAIVTLDIERHAFFRRDGDDVRVDLPIRLGEAVLGAKVRAPTVDGPVTLTIPAGATSGRVLRLRAKGFTRKGGERGDQYVTLMIDVPAADAELEAFARDWASDRDRNPRAALGVE